MITFDSDTVIAVVSIATLIIVVGGGIYWFGKLVNRVDQLENKTDQIESKVDRLSEEMRDMREEMRDMREEMRDMREEIRRGNQQLLLALANHGHDDDGQPVFRVPVSME